MIILGGFWKGYMVTRSYIDYGLIITGFSSGAPGSLSQVAVWVFNVLSVAYWG